MHHIYHIQKKTDKWHVLHALFVWLLLLGAAAKMP
jgi:hypothetical protein